MHTPSTPALPGRPPRPRVLGALLLLFAAAAGGCERPEREMRSLPLDLPVGDARAIDLSVEQPGGQLDLEEGMEGRVGGGFAFDHEDMEPKVRVAREEGRLRLALSAPGWRTGIGPTTNLWRVRLPPALPVAIRVKIGSGRVVLHPARLTLESFVLEQGFGEVSLDLTKCEPAGAVPISLRLGTAGRVTVDLPDSVRLRVRARKAVGTLTVSGLERRGEELWTNEAWEEGEGPGFDVTLITGAGEVEIRARSR